MGVSGCSDSDGADEEMRKSESLAEKYEKEREMRVNEDVAANGKSMKMKEEKKQDEEKRGKGKKMRERESNKT